MAYGSMEEALTLGVGIERSFPCPVHDDSNPSASINAITGYWCCYSCGAWGKADMDRLEFDPLQVKKMVDRITEKMNPVHQIYPEGWLSVFDASGPGPYWSSRFIESASRHFRLGQTADGTFATIPMRDQHGNVLGVIRRDLTGQGQKYLYPYGVDVTKYIFDIHRATKDVLILTEGATDAIAVWEAGFDNAVALYGRGMSRAQAQLIRKHSPTKIMTMQDQDDAGEGAHTRVVALLGKEYPIERVYWDSYKDLASIPLQERVEMLTQITSETPQIRLANGAQTRVGSTPCGSSRQEVKKTSSSSTRKLVVRRKRQETTLS